MSENILGDQSRRKMLKTTGGVVGLGGTILASSGTAVASTIAESNPDYQEELGHVYDSWNKYDLNHESRAQVWEPVQTFGDQYIIPVEVSGFTQIGEYVDPGDPEPRDQIFETSWEISCPKTLSSPQDGDYTGITAQGSDVEDSDVNDSRMEGLVSTLVTASTAYWGFGPVASVVASSIADSIFGSNDAISRTWNWDPDSAGKASQVTSWVRFYVEGLDPGESADIDVNNYTTYGIPDYGADGISNTGDLNTLTITAPY
ncbi:hypothetical protein [Halorubrum distributum]|uniref:Uncharacterized protein n=1 Tax=Halorubrum distributum TaxID=29283 RepID=A0A6B1IKE8_9EURY|nr:hypothetical protein [Halorubrum terrestre]MYL66844.1 hypothetical protein [Halorubrum terrestre]